MIAKIILTSSKRKIYVRIRNVSLAFLFGLVIINWSGQLEYTANNLFGKYSLVVASSLLITSLLTLFISHILSRKKIKYGKLSMSNDLISIEIRNTKLDFETDSLSNFKIRQGTEDVKPEFTALLSSYDNWLSFNYKNEEYNFQFIIESTYQSNQLNDLIKYWESKTDFAFVREKN